MAEISRQTIDLSRARVLLTNDDGIDAAGMRTAVDILRPLCGSLTVVAPDRWRSGMGRAVTIRQELHVTPHTHDGEFSCSGTPADCVIAGLQMVMADDPPDLVISGINNGANLGDDITASGTAGAAIEACLQHLPAIAMSIDSDFKHDPNWETARLVLPDLLTRLCKFGFTRDVFFNVNLPNLPYDDVGPVAVVPHGRMDQASSFLAQPMDLDDREGSPLRFTIHHRGGVGLRSGDHDYHRMAAGQVTVTPVSVMLSDETAVPALRDHFSR